MPARRTGEIPKKFKVELLLTPAEALKIAREATEHDDATASSRLVQRASFQIVQQLRSAGIKI